MSQQIRESLEPILKWLPEYCKQFIQTSGFVNQMNWWIKNDCWNLIQNISLFVNQIYIQHSTVYCIMSQSELFLIKWVINLRAACERIIQTGFVNQI